MLFSLLFSRSSLHPSLLYRRSLLQSNVWKAHLRDCEPVPPSLLGQPVRLLPDGGARVLRDGVHSRRRPDDAHSHWRLHRTAGCVGLSSHQSSRNSQCNFTFSYSDCWRCSYQRKETFDHLILSFSRFRQHVVASRCILCFRCICANGQN